MEKTINNLEKFEDNYIDTLKKADYSKAESTPESIVSSPQTSPVYLFTHDAEFVDIEVIEDIQGQPEKSLGLQPVKSNILLRLLSCSEDYETLTFRIGDGHNIIKIGRQDCIHIWGNLGDKVV